MEYSILENQFDRKSLTGVYANKFLLGLLNQINNQQVLVETRDRKQFLGTFSAISANNDVALKWAWEKTEKNKNNILPLKAHAKEKMVINLENIIAISTIVADVKPSNTGFATDREYHVKNRLVAVEEELVSWECDEELEVELTTDLDDTRNNSKRGWDVNEMFKANASLHGVKSTFVEDMSQYTTVDFKATAEAKAKADAIARQIEGNSKSHIYARLENDDDERDLDKTTEAQEVVPEETVSSQDVDEQGENIPTPSDHDQESIAIEVFEEEQLELTVGQEPLNHDERPVFTVNNNPDGQSVASSVDGKKFTFNPHAAVFQPTPTTHEQSPVPIPSQQHTPMQSPIPSVPPGMIPQSRMMPTTWPHLYMPTPFAFYPPQHPQMMHVVPPQPANINPRRNGPQPPMMQLHHPGQHWTQASIPYVPHQFPFVSPYQHVYCAPAHGQISINHVPPPPGHNSRHHPQQQYQEYRP